MNAFITQVKSADDYRKSLRTWRTVVYYFGHPHCLACEMAGPVFEQVAKPYLPYAFFYMLNTSECPRHLEVSGTPTVLIWRNGKLLSKMKGIGSRLKLEAELERHIPKRRPMRQSPLPRHDLPWLQNTLSTLCTIPRAKRWNFS
ncbi:thioredoxin family protein [Pseudomonas sp. SDO52101_S400]